MGLFSKLFRGASGSLDPGSVWRDLIGHSPVLYGLPEDVLKEISQRIEVVTARKGDVIIQQGDSGDAFYVVSQGKVSVTRKDSPDAKPVKLATVPQGFGFGEEALISGRPRNATLTMATDGVLLKLLATDFQDLLQKATLNWQAPIQARTAVSRHGAIWLDVRSEEEFTQGSLDGAVSVPLHRLREIMRKKDRSKLYICICEDSRLSATAAYVLDQLGFQAAVLKGGLAALRKVCGKDIGGRIPD